MNSEPRYTVEEFLDILQPALVARFSGREAYSTKHRYRALPDKVQGGPSDEAEERREEQGEGHHHDDVQKSTDRRRELELTNLNSSQVDVSPLRGAHAPAGVPKGTNRISMKKVSKSSRRASLGSIMLNEDVETIICKRLIGSVTNKATENQVCPADGTIADDSAVNLEGGGGGVEEVGLPRYTIEQITMESLGFMSFW